MTDPSHRHGYDPDDLQAWLAPGLFPPCSTCDARAVAAWDFDLGHRAYACEAHEREAIELALTEGPS